MSKRAYLDINIVIDIIDEARINYDKAKKLLLKFIKDEYVV